MSDAPDVFAVTTPHDDGQQVSLTLDVPGQRVDVTLAEYFEHLSRNAVQRLIQAGHVLVNDKPVKASYRAEGGEQVVVTLPPVEVIGVQPEDIPLDILYEDAALAAVNKPAGLVVHPAVGHLSGTLVNAALARWPQMRDVGADERYGLVHRLDKDTSGVILLAKTPQAWEFVQDQFRNRTVHKRYLALVEGIPESSEGVIDVPLGRNPESRKRITALPDGRVALSRYRLLETFPEHALLEVLPETGRTHQIRVHLAWLGHPVAGDRVYGRRKATVPLTRHWLHAESLTVQSPINGETFTITAPLPPELEAVLAALR